MFTAGNNENINDDKTKQQSMDKAAMLLVISMKGMCCSCCTQPICCHFGWQQCHTRPRLVISDIIDTAPPHNNNNNSNGEPTIVAGPSMNSTQSSFGAAVVDNQIFVVGGSVDHGRSTSVESLLFQWQPQDKDKDLSMLGD